MRLPIEPHADLEVALSACATCRLDMDSNTIVLLIPETVYTPDRWTMELLRGLRSHLSTTGSAKVVAEVGVGSGIVPLCLWLWRRSDQEFTYIGMDVNPVACQAARINLGLNGCDLSYELIPKGHLLEHLRAVRVDLFVANLPQVPAPPGEAENLNDYYPIPAAADPGTMRMCWLGLGLVHEFLEQARPRLGAGGSVLLTLAGRCGMTEIDQMMAKCGMRYTIVCEARIGHEPSTLLDGFVAAEQRGVVMFNFYLSADAKVSVSATAAQAAILRGQRVYHDLYVVAAWPA